MPARKRFGQNFLHDPAVIDRLLAAIDARPGQNIVEIGPGRGALTFPLLRQTGQLNAIEIDRDLVPLLREQSQGLGELIIHQEDALKVDYGRFSDAGPLRLIGNLPYNISSPLLFHILASAAPIEDMHFMLQREVVDRIVAEPGSKNYGRLSVAIAARAGAQQIMRVGAGAFTPAPKVESAVVRLQPRLPEYHIENMQDFDRVLAQAFSLRRKTLRNALRPLLDAQAMEKANIDPSLRAENLTPAAFAALSNVLTQTRQESRPDPTQ